MQQAIQEAKKMRDELKDRFNDYDMEYCMCYSNLSELIERLEKLPQEPTTDELLEEMPIKRNNANLHLYLDGEWCAEYMYEMDSGMIDIGGYGTTPRLALIELKEKLSTNQ